MTRRVVLGSNYERTGDGESPVVKPLVKNTSEQLTEKYIFIYLVDLAVTSTLQLARYRLYSDVVPYQVRSQVLFYVFDLIILGSSL